MTKLHPTIEKVTNDIIARSKDSRLAYLDLVKERFSSDFARWKKTEGNIAHATAGCAALDKAELLGKGWPAIGVITSYNDMLSAHKPYENYPNIIREAARKHGAIAQIAGGVPAMCDGVTQGQEGMELSLFSRDIIAMASAVGLSHDVFDAAIHLGVCDKIVPGLVIAALRFGWLPSVFIPAGPMPSGLPNPEKVRIRQAFAEGKVGRDALLKAETESYHSEGTCTFYGTANSNQMIMEMMGFHLPGAAFINPSDPLRQALTEDAVARISEKAKSKSLQDCSGVMINEKSFVNALVGLMATGGSTNLALHLPAMALAAGIKITLDDIALISETTPLLARIYPNGPADVNHFHAAGGMGFLTRELLNAGLMHGDVEGVFGPMSGYVVEPGLDDGELVWRNAPSQSGDIEILRPVSDPFSPDGGLRLLKGPLGTGICKVSAIKPENQIVKAPARVFDTQSAFKTAFSNGDLNQDFIAVVRFQGPSANGMPELHSLSPALGALQDKGFKVGLVTDGRMSGASGKIPSAIHVSPEASKGGMLARVEDGDVITLDCVNGVLDINADLTSRQPVMLSSNHQTFGMGRELFDVFRQNVSSAEEGASPFRLAED